MADEFSKLQNVSLISESDLRDDVAANIEAKSSKESIADQTLVKNAWRAFQEAEELVNNLHGQLRAAELTEANKAIGVTNNALHTSSDKDQKTTSQTVLSAAALRFKHNAALRELDKKGEKLRQVQREVEERQRRRLEEIRSRQRTEAIHEQMRIHNNDGNMDTTAMNTMHEEYGVNVEESPSPAIASVQDGRQHKNTDTISNNSSVNSKSDALQRNQVKSHEHTARPQRVFGTTMTSYSGGAVLPSLNRVLVSRADIQAKHLRYEDDADIALYAARLRKRKKLEKANALLRAQRRHDQANQCDEMQSSQTSSEFTDFTDTQSIITSASTNTNTTTTANTDILNVDNVDEGKNNIRSDKIVKEEEKITNVKRENESHDQRGNSNQFTNSTSAASAAVEGAEKMHKVVTKENENSVGKVKVEKLEEEEQELLEHQPSPQAEEEEEAKDDNPITAIDIDALMEEEEDVGDDLVQKLLAEQQQQASSLSLSESRTNDKEGKGSVIKREGNTFEEEEQEEQKELMESTEAKTRHSSKDTHPIDYSHITLKPERQVEIIPGIKISARIYRRLFPYQQEGLR